MIDSAATVKVAVRFVGINISIMHFCKSFLLQLGAFSSFHSCVDALSIGQTRREVGTTAATAFGGVLSSSGVTSPVSASADDANNAAAFTPYQIFPDASATLYPTLKPIQPSDLYRTLSMIDANSGGAIWLGEHHNSAKDHKLQADFVTTIYNLRQKKFGAGNKMSVGLEMVVSSQPHMNYKSHQCK